jgi:nuclear pore complex protein Nup98-Nup96
LEDAVAPAVDADLKKNPTADSAAVAFTLLTGNQVQKASETAMDGRNFKLATLISQASGDLEFKADLRDQLQVWRDQRIDVHINENIRKIYGLLGGITEVVEGSKGTGLEKCPDLVISKGLDWKRTFGLYLWFAEAGETPLAAVFQTYDQAQKDSAALIASPLPSYSGLSPHAAKSLTWKLPPLTRLPPDASFSLIKLFSDPVCSLSTILTPYSFGPSPVDYSLPWHLYIILSRCMRIRDFADRGDPGIDVDASAEGYRVEGHSPSADLLASTYALQLEQLGMIQEALFVLLHIEGSAGCVIFHFPSM